jgi:hypothetical protein
MGFDLTHLLKIRTFALVRFCRKNGNKMRHYISYSYTSRKPMIQLGAKYCIQYSHRILNLSILLHLLLHTIPCIRQCNY